MLFRSSSLSLCSIVIFYICCFLLSHIFVREKPLFTTAPLLTCSADFNIAAVSLANRPESKSPLSKIISLCFFLSIYYHKREEN